MVWRQIQRTMYNATQAQLTGEKWLAGKGFQFCNWLPYQPNAENQPSEGTEHLGTMLMVKRTHRFAKEYAEVEPDGTIN